MTQSYKKHQQNETINIVFPKILVSTSTCNATIVHCKCLEIC